MDYNIDNLKNLLDQLKTIGFFKRLFSWKNINRILVDAGGDLQKLISSNEVLRSESQRLETNLGLASNDIKNLNARNAELKDELPTLKNRLANAEQELKRLNEINTRLLSEEETRKREYFNQVSTLNKTQEEIRQDRIKEIEERSRQSIEILKKQKETWGNHQTDVKNRIKGICSKHTIEYVEKVPFKGEPDNTLKICDEFVIFDAKSPANDDLSNFPNYLKDQAEKAKKYIKEENVKTDIFFVVPSNTLGILPQFVFGLADYNLFIISIDSLEPIILGLQKIEDYEFAEQLSPEERENICRVLGKFAHLTKRRIQVDSYFAKQAIELSYKCESDLPKDVLSKVVEFERSEKLNPPIEKRAKVINIKELEGDSKKLKDEAGSKGIVFEEEGFLKTVNNLPLYKTENE